MRKTNASPKQHATPSTARAKKPTVSTATSARIGVRVLANSAIAMGPGKADLLEAIASTGSISAAARSMGMSYRRAWLLVDTMNGCFAEPLVIKEKGGVEGGGASLSTTGTQVLRKYRRLSALVMKEFATLLRDS